MFSPPKMGVKKCMNLQQSLLPITILRGGAFSFSQSHAQRKAKHSDPLGR